MFPLLFPAQGLFATLTKLKSTNKKIVSLNKVWLCEKGEEKKWNNILLISEHFFTFLSISSYLHAKCIIFKHIPTLFHTILIVFAWLGVAHIFN